MRMLIRRSAVIESFKVAIVNVGVIITSVFKNMPKNGRALLYEFMFPL